MNEPTRHDQPEALPETLQQWLETSAPVPPPPDWNDLSRRIDRPRRRAVRRWIWGLGVPATAAVALALALRPGGPVPTRADETFELIAQLDMFEAYDMLSEVDADTLALLAEVEP
ncbi:MAG: hypothetical protein D6761_02895 [Candidatus Dadabacteria bacterium]|nr:MAG: hypothetical protein D6761_02895 [Candidatus Dadabacteria bacterium]